MLQRILGVLKLDANTYEEIEHDKGATMQAAIIVAISAVLSSIGAAIAARQAASSLAGIEDALQGQELPGFIDTFISAAGSPTSAFLSTFVTAFLVWVSWAVVTWFIGTKLFGGKADIGEMLRVLGFARIPSALGVLAFVPCLGGIVGLVGFVWSLACGFTAVRQGLDLDNGKAALTIILSAIPAWIIAGVFGAVVGLLGI